MTPRPDDDPDDEALTWAGDEEPGRATGRPAPSRGRADAFDPDPARTDELEAAIHRADAELEGLSLDGSPGTVVSASFARPAATALFAVVYLLVTVGWVLSVQYTSSGSSSLAVDLPWQFGEFMAMAAGPLVFVAVRQLTAARPAGAAVLGWLGGALLLLPWPILTLLARGGA